MGLGDFFGDVAPIAGTVIGGAFGGPAGAAIGGSIGGAIGGGISGSEPQSVSSTQNRDPWSGLQPFLKDIYGKAQAQQEQFAPSFFPGQTFAPFDPLQVAAQNMASQYITGQGVPDFNVPQNLPSQIPTFMPRGAFPFYQQPEAVPGGSIGSPFGVEPQPDNGGGQEPSQFGGDAPAGDAFADMLGNLGIPSPHTGLFRGLTADQLQSGNIPAGNTMAATMNQMPGVQGLGDIFQGLTMDEIQSGEIAQRAQQRPMTDVMPGIGQHPQNLTDIFSMMPGV